jgi:large subunit ribosomal protein L32
MVVPKRKTSKSRRNKRSANKGLRSPGLSLCPQCDEPKLPHRACFSCGYYKDIKVLPGQEAE